MLKLSKNKASAYGLGLLILSTLNGCQPSSKIWSVPTDAQDLNTLRSPAPPPLKRVGHPLKKKQLPPTKENIPSNLPANFHKKVSLLINEHVPLKEAITQLAFQNGINLQMDPSLQKSLLFSAHNRPFYEILQDVCALADLRFQIINNNAVRIVADTPYAVTYNIQFLNLTRTTDNKISIATDVFSSMKDQKNSADNGSNSLIQAKGESNFWTEVEQNLKIILNEQGDAAQTFTIHKSGGIISVRATVKQHRLVEHYLETLRRSTSSQVLIEAKIIEVTLKDDYKSGINWQKLAQGALRINMPFGTMSQRSRFLDPLSGQGDMLSFGAESKQFTALIRAISEFGSTRTLSSPRLTVMNNQTAILKVAQNQVYFRLNYDKQYSLNINRETVNLSSDIMTVPIGLVMSVQPSIDSELGKVTLSLRPTISRLSKSVSDPAVDIAFNATNNSTSGAIDHKPSLVPVVEVREIDSVLQVTDGGIAVLGGLMETRSARGEAGLPGTEDSPLLKRLFSAQSRTEEVVELVILIKATIVRGDEDFQIADQRLYEDYIDDPRPFIEK